MKLLGARRSLIRGGRALSDRAPGPSWRDLGVLGLWAALALLYLFLPIFVVILFSFNDNKGRFNLTWQGFTLDTGSTRSAPSGSGGAGQLARDRARSRRSIAVVLGTFMALALVRYRFRGRGGVDFFVFLPLATPEVVLGAALLGLFLTMNFATGFATIVIAHVMFNVSLRGRDDEGAARGDGPPHRGGGDGPRRRTSGRRSARSRCR